MNNSHIRVIINNSARAINLFSGNSQAELNFNLTDIPHGHHYIEVSASCEVLLFDNGFSSTYPVPQSGTHSIDFTVAPVPTPSPATTPTPAPIISSLNLEQTVIVIAGVITFAVIALAFYRRHQNTTAPKSS